MEGCKRLPDLFEQMRGETGGNPNAEVSIVTATGNQPNRRGESPANAPAIQIQKGKKKECPEELQAPIADLEKRLRSKTMDLTGQNRTRYQAVLKFLYYQKSQRDGETRQSMALSVARCFNRGKWFAEKLVS